MTLVSHIKRPEIVVMWRTYILRTTTVFDICTKNPNVRRKYYKKDIARHASGEKTTHKKLTKIIYQKVYT